VVALSMIMFINVSLAVVASRAGKLGSGALSDKGAPMVF
jgi:hypothetical protein